MASRTISVIGGLDYDLVMIANRIPEPRESLVANRYFESLGGKGANTAVAVYRACHKRPQCIQDPAYAEEQNHELLEKQQLDNVEEFLAQPQVNVKLIGAVGDDKYGAEFHTELAKVGIDCSGVVTVPNFQTAICFVMVEDYTRDNRCLFTPGASASWKREHFRTAEQLGHGIRPDLVISQMEIDREVVEQMIETAGKANIDFVLQAAPSSPLTKRIYQWITHLLCNGAEAAIMSGRDPEEVNESSWNEICQEFLDRGVKNVVITLGGQGAYYANATKRGLAPAYQVDALDTTGAGSTFGGVYAVEYLRQKESIVGAWDIEQAVVRANRASAIAITKLGAQSGIPWADEIDQFNAPLIDLEKRAASNGTSRS